SLGVVFHPAFPPETLPDYARRAEAAGLDELWFWEDCFYAGAFTSAAVALGATRKIKVGIGILPAVARNPLFAAMEITTLARLYPGRFLPGFGHGVDLWMKQIGAYPKSPLKTLGETVEAVRRLLHGEKVTLHGNHVHLDEVQMRLVAEVVPPLFIGGIREKSLRLAGRHGDGAILTALSSPAYVRWAGEQIRSGMEESGRRQNQRVVFVLCQVDPEGLAARLSARGAIAAGVARGDPHLKSLGIAEQAVEMVQTYGVEGAAARIPEAWVDELAAAGTPHQAAAMLKRLEDAGADSIVLQSITADPADLDVYIHSLLPLLK
ncbi:MAG: LLM class flavin-dependent oxidoreductase, partial [Anaerolineae bacterium]|nr:LLM class flavin-dependent oxidoreductase [Anaerolineae bacterium]